MLIYQPIAQGLLGDRAQTRRMKIAVALDKVTLIRTSTVLVQNDDVPITLTSSQGKSIKEKKISRQSNESQNNRDPRQNYVESTARSPGETPWAQGIFDTEENSSSSRQSYLDQNINSSRQNADVLIALTSSQDQSVKEKKFCRQSNESQKQQVWTELC